MVKCKMCDFRRKDKEVECEEYEEYEKNARISLQVSCKPKSRKMI